MKNIEKIINETCAEIDVENLINTMVPGWRSVKESLPKPFERVLVAVETWDGYLIAQFGHLKHDDRWYVNDTSRDIIEQNVKYWMPIPRLTNLIW